MDDLVERLEKSTVTRRCIDVQGYFVTEAIPHRLCAEAASRIRELDRQVEENAKLGRELWELACRKVKEAEAALADNERLREALKPFVAALEEYGDEDSKRDADTVWDTGAGMLITFGHLRKATQTLKGDANDA